MCQSLIRRRSFQARFSTIPEHTSGEAQVQEKKSIPETLRRLMRSLPSSVVVLTTSVTEPEVTGAAKPSPETFYRGMTLSSFTTLSLAPPLITFNIRAPSRTLSAIKQSGVFFIHVLEANQDGATVADSFTKGNADGIEVGEAFRARDGSFKVDNVTFELRRKGEDSSGNSELDLPKLTGKGVKRVLACELYGSHSNPDIPDGIIEVGEHVLVVARVSAIFPHEGLAQTKKEGEYGLSYVDGRYRMVGRAIMAHNTKNDVKKADGII